MRSKVRSFLYTFTSFDSHLDPSRFTDDDNEKAILNFHFSQLDLVYGEEENRDVLAMVNKEAQFDATMEILKR